MILTSARVVTVSLLVTTLTALNALTNGQYLALGGSGAQYEAGFDNQSICFTYFMTIPITREAQSGLFSGNLSAESTIPPLLGTGESSEALPSTSDQPSGLNSPVGASGDSISRILHYTQCHARHPNTCCAYRPYHQHQWPVIDNQYRSWQAPGAS